MPDRRQAAYSLTIGIVLMVYTLVLLLLVLLLAIPLWVLNNLWAFLTGSGFLAENSRVGYYLYWGQSNVQALMTGRGEFEALP